MTVVLFDKTHEEETDIDDTGDEGLSNFKKILEEEGLELVETSKSLVEDLKNADILWISFPRVEFSPEELGEVERFVENGGGLLLMGEWGNLFGNIDILNTLSTKFGITFNKDRITDVEHAFTEDVKFMGEVIDRKKVPQFVKINVFTEHPVTAGIKELVYFAGCSLDAAKEKVLAWSAPSAFADLDADRKLDLTEVKGSMGVACYGESGKGRVICVGDSSLPLNKYIVHGDNERFSVNIMRWLAKKLEGPPTEVKRRKKKKRGSSEIYTQF